MRNYRKLRLIQKGELGMSITGNATLTQSAQDAVNKQLQQYTQGIRNNIYFNQALTQYAPQLFNVLSNLGVTTGNSTLANMGQLGDTLSNLGQLRQNWGSLDSMGKAGGVAGIAGQTADTLDNMFFSKQHANDSALTKGLNSAYDSVSSAAMMFTPVGTIVGGAMKVGKFLGDGLSALGVGTDQMTTTDQILDSNFMKLTPTGLVNALGAQRTQQFSANQDTIEKVGGSYGGSVNLINDAVSKANKKYGLFSSGARRKANALIDTARDQQSTMTRISNEYQDQLANKSDLAYTRYNMDINGGYQQQYIRAAKQGAVLERISLKRHRQGGELNCKINIESQEIEWQPVIKTDIKETQEFKEGGEISLQEWQPVIKTDIKETQEFKEGGEISLQEWQPVIKTDIKEVVTMADGGKTESKQEEAKQEETTQKNVIPEGALHARKHHMEHAEDLTKKGIPVVDNKGEQQAEVEKNEIIFTLEVTKQLEELHKKYQEASQKEKDELAIEAGKLLVYEIMHNTIDRTGLIKECKKGGVSDGNK